MECMCLYSVHVYVYVDSLKNVKRREAHVITPYTCIYNTKRSYTYMGVVGSSPTRGSSFFLGEVTALGVLCCFTLFVCLFGLACFFLSSFSSLIKNMHICYVSLTGAEQQG